MANIKPISICAYCVKEPRFKAVDEGIRKLGTSMRDSGRIQEFLDMFTHGSCRRHFEEALRDSNMFSDDQIKQMVDKALSKSAAPDLEQHPELVALYSRGIFAPEQIDAIQQGQATMKEGFIKF